MVNIGKKYQKGALLREKGQNKYKSYLNAHLHINMNSHIQVQENTSKSLGGVGITNFF